ncbi:MAG: helix-turn-helix transcriptional regulator [Mycobacterium sp.]
MDELVGENLEAIGAALRDARVNAMRTQSEIGQQAGVSRQLVSRIEQGCNGEISAYIAVAAALQYRLTLINQDTRIEAGPAVLDFV